MKIRHQIILFFNIFLIFLASLGFCREKAVYGKVNVKILPEIAYKISSGKFQYKYLVISSKSSLQEVKEIIITSIGEVSAKIATPEGWEFVPFDGPRHPSIPPMVQWYAGWGDLPEGKKIKGHTDGTPSPTPFQIKPGQFLDGFFMECNELPGIVDFYAEGYTRLLTVEEDPESSLPPNYTFLDDLFKGKTIGPVPLLNKSPEVLVDRLITLNEEVIKYEWIKNSAVTKKLGARLEAVKDGIFKSDSKGAKDQLSLFIADLDTQKGKEIQENAWALLRANAEYLISLIEK